MFFSRHKQITQFKFDFLILKLSLVFELAQIQGEPELLDSQFEEFRNGFFVQEFFVQLDMKLVFFEHLSQHQDCE